VIWTEGGVAGAGRFIQRVSRLIDDVLEKGATPGTVRPEAFGADAMVLRRAAHRALDGVGASIEGLRFNVAVAQIYDFANGLQAALGKSDLTPDLAWALREAGTFMAQMISPMMPHLAEDAWARLGYNTLVANEPWAQVESALLVDDAITIAVQVNGKRRDELTIARTANSQQIEAAALKLDSIVRALEGRTPKKVIVVPQRIVNVVV
jgi:leucyl-tRNA synthetase